MDLLLTMPACAPLAEDQVRDLLIYSERLLPRGREGRPRQGTPDKMVRQEQRQQQVLEKLLADIIPARQRVFEQLDVLVRSNQLTRRALLDLLYPAPLTPYAERLTDWGREKFLWFDQQGHPAPQPTAAILLQRELDGRKRKLPPPRALPRSFFCWRHDAPGQLPVAYELPLVLRDDARLSMYQVRPEPSPYPYVLSTPWKGAIWDSSEWILVEGEAIRWVGEPDEGTLARWLSPQERDHFSAPGAQNHTESLSRQALRVLANRLKHHPVSYG